MEWILYAFSLIFIVSGTCMILYTMASRAIFRKFIEMGFKTLSIIAGVVGLLLLLSASASHYPWLLRIVGILSILEGVLLYTNPQDIMGKIYGWYLDTASDQTFRATGIVTVIIGTALFSWIN